MRADEIAIEVHFDSGNIMTRSGRRAQIGICGFAAKLITGGNKNCAYLGVIPVACSSVESPRLRTSSYSREIQSIFYAADTARFLKSLAPELLFGIEAVSIYHRMFEMIIRTMCVR